MTLHRSRQVTLMVEKVQRLILVSLISITKITAFVQRCVDFSYSPSYVRLTD